MQLSMFAVALAGGALLLWLLPPVDDSAVGQYLRTGMIVFGAFSALTAIWMIVYLTRGRYEVSSRGIYCPTRLRPWTLWNAVLLIDLAPDSVGDPRFFARLELNDGRRRTLSFPSGVVDKVEFAVAVVEAAPTHVRVERAIRRAAEQS